MAKAKKRQDDAEDAKGSAKPINVRPSPQQLERLDSYLATLRFAPTRQALLLRLLDEFLDTQDQAAK